MNDRKKGLPKPDRECDYGTCSRSDSDLKRRCLTNGKQYQYCDDHDPLKNDQIDSDNWEMVGGGE